MCSLAASGRDCSCYEGRPDTSAPDAGQERGDAQHQHAQAGQEPGLVLGHPPGRQGRACGGCILGSHLASGRHPPAATPTRSCSTGSPPATPARPSIPPAPSTSPAPANPSRTNAELHQGGNLVRGTALRKAARSLSEPGDQRQVERRAHARDRQIELDPPFELGARERAVEPPASLAAEQPLEPASLEADRDDDEVIGDTLALGAALDRDDNLPLTGVDQDCPPGERTKAVKLVENRFG